MTGKFIVFEGPDGAGKSTQLTLVARELADAGIEVHCTREPGGTELAETLRGFAFNNSLSPLMDTCIMYAARMHHFVHMIEPMLCEGKWILCDRYTSSTYAYQSVKGVDMSTLHQMEQSYLSSFIGRKATPDLEVFLDVTPDVSATRRMARKGPDDRFEDLVNQVYLKYYQRYSGFAPSWKLHKVDASVKMNDVTEAIMNEIRTLL